MRCRCRVLLSPAPHQSPHLQPEVALLLGSPQICSTVHRIRWSVSIPVYMDISGLSRRLGLLRARGRREEMSQGDVVWRMLG